MELNLIFQPKESSPLTADWHHHFLDLEPLAIYIPSLPAQHMQSNYVCEFVCVQSLYNGRAAFISLTNYLTINLITDRIPVRLI